MQKIFSLFLLCGILSGCEPDNTPTDVPARASGKYIVQYYAINGDTLYAGKTVNKLGLREFYILVDRKSSDSVRVGSTYKTLDQAGSHTHVKYAAIAENKGTFLFSVSTASTQAYESRIVGNTFYERTALGGPALVVIPPAYELKMPVDSSTAGITIVAVKQ